MLVSRLDKLEEEIFNHSFKLSPRQAVVLGLHDYDGLLPDISPGGLKSWTDKALGLLERVRSESHGLDKDGRLDALCLETMLERMLFDVQDLKGYATRPNLYSMQLSVTPYISREYAPIDARIGAVNKHLGRVPGFLDQASRNLDKTLPQPIVDVASKQVQGVLRDLDGNAAQEAGKASGPIREELENLKRDAVVAMASFIEELSEEHSIHEVFPGHYTHRVFQREFGNSMTRKAYWNYSFGEGWAHYCEEMMLDEGYGNEQLRLIQLKEALLRDCRFIVSFWMHTQSLGVNEARQFIMENAYMQRFPAEREAWRVAFAHSS